MVVLVGGQTKTIQVFISFSAVTYRFSVVPTEIQDRYSVILEATFTTTVPIPVILLTPNVVDMRVLRAQGTKQILFTVENKGLIAADSLNLQLPQLSDIRFSGTHRNMGRE